MAGPVATLYCGWSGPRIILQRGCTPTYEVPCDCAVLSTAWDICSIGGHNYVPTNQGLYELR